MCSDFFLDIVFDEYGKSSRSNILQGKPKSQFIFPKNLKTYSYFGY